jgi:hypothetical protein
MIALSLRLPFFLDIIDLNYSVLPRLTAHHLCLHTTAKMRVTPALRMQATRVLRMGHGPDPKNGVYVKQ